MNIEEIAKKIILKLTAQGYQAYYAGGFVRDLLLGVMSDDIDIATNASPDEIKGLFDKTVDVGERFGCVVVVEEGEAFEVTTFRRDGCYNGRHPDEVEFCEAKEDSFRRDFTVNGMFYDPIESKVIDYVEGKKDLKAGILRAIGNAHERFEEDRLRMLRAIRFTVCLNFSLDSLTKQAIISHAKHLFPSVARERIWKEWSRMVGSREQFCKAIVLLEECFLLDEIFPPSICSSRESSKIILSRLEGFSEQLDCFDYVLMLFSNATYDQLIAIVEFLKLSKSEKKLTKIFCLCREFVSLWLKEDITEDHQWLEILSHKNGKMYVLLSLVSYDLSNKEIYFEKILEKENSLKEYLALKKESKYILNAQFLQKEGIPPGRILGSLLVKGERLAVNKKLKKPEEILDLLRSCDIWPLKEK
jgi:poly(A) polymerase